MYGGVVSNTVGRIGAGRVGSTTGVGWVTVGGAGSKWTNSGNLYLGYSVNVGISGNDPPRRSSKVARSRTSDFAIGYDPLSTGIVNIGGVGSEAAAGVGTLDAPSVTFGAGNGTLNFNHIDTSGDYAFAAAMSGAGTINHLAGVTTLSGASGGFSGATDVSGGTLLVNGTLGGTVAVDRWRIAWRHRHAHRRGQHRRWRHASGPAGRDPDDGLADARRCLQCQCRPWRAGQPLALFDVTGNLTLDGILNVQDLGGFGAGALPDFQLWRRADQQRHGHWIDAGGCIGQRSLHSDRDCRRGQSGQQPPVYAHLLDGRTVRQWRYGRGWRLEHRQQQLDGRERHGERRPGATASLPSSRATPAPSPWKPAPASRSLACSSPSTATRSPETRSRCSIARRSSALEREHPAARP